MLVHLRRNILNVPSLSELPARIRASIVERDWANELLLRSIQLGIILFFCLVYTISPKTFPAGAFAPAPYVLGAYLVLSIIGLAWGYLRRPPDWASYVSILFDFTLLYGLMISFHLQYEQPASFVLKAPALLYVFIFIAIRALRFHPKFVLVAGLVATLGWAAVMVYVTRVDPGDNMLTRSYVEYLTSNRILIGAEVDKIISIIVVTAVLAIAVNGSRNLLVTAMAETSAAADFERFFDSSVASGIRSSEQRLIAGQAVKKQATILTVDIRGFTKLAERWDADAVMRILSAYQRRTVPLIQANGGIIDKFIGDGILASFGVGTASNTCEADALKAAEAILRDFQQWRQDPDLAIPGETLRIGIGIASGVVNWGTVGHDDRLEMTVIGPAVNLAARLEKHNKALGSSCIAQSSTWDLAQAQGYSGTLSAHHDAAQLEGLDASTRFVVLTLPGGRDALAVRPIADPARAS